MNQVGFPGGSDDKESACNARDLVQSLGGEDPMEKGMATHSSILPGEVHGQRSLAGYSSQGRKELDTTEATQYGTQHVFLRWEAFMF